MMLAPPRLYPGEWRLAHQSVTFAAVPRGDPAMKERILRGQARKFGTVMGPKGETLDLIRFKGTTYRRETPKAPSKRDLWRRK